MNPDAIKELLLCSLAFNYSILLIWFGAFSLARDWMYRLHSRWFNLSAQTFDALVRPQGQLINRVKVPVGVSHNVVAISNCVIAKWGGEQLEAKGQSVEPALSVVVRDNESDSAGQGGESASE
jgi:hypothetical protein